jgi:O-antigen ligase
MSSLLPAQRAFLLLLFVVGIGFCQPVHVFPLPNYFEEVLVALGLLLVVGGLFWKTNELRFSLWFFMWLGLGGLFVLSAWLHPAPFASYKLLIGVFWFIGLLALVAGDQLDWERDGARFARWLAVALLAIALICATGGLLRFYGLLGSFWRAYVPEPNTGRMTGLVGHSNFFAFISFFGLLAAGWLHNICRLPLWLGLVSVLLLCAGIIGSGARAVLVAWVLVMVVLAMRRQKADAAGWLWFMLGAFVFYWLFRPVFFIFDGWFSALAHANGWTGGAGTSSSDVLARGAVSNERLSEWRVALELLRDNFWTGIGIGSYGVRSYEQHLLMQLPSSGGLFSHAHNSPLQLVVELGVAGLLWVLALVVLAARAFWYASMDKARLLPALVVLTIQLYGVFEFPLWIMHFLVLHMVLLSALGGPSWTVKFKLGKLFSGITLLLALVVAVVYVPLMERFLWSYRQYFLRHEVVQRDYAFVDGVIRDPLLSPYGYMVYFANFELSPISLDKERDALQRLKAYLPYPQVLIRLAMVNLIDGDEQQAQKTLADMRLFYGEGYESMLAEQTAATQKMFPKVPFERLKLPIAAKPAE